ncbi:hypothetical protein HYX08_00030 [Candidatus Woesearchaeota archaeon]|nr:hypothetical protein [Candidatus Woesearchaeota archaeon]
MTGLTTSTHFLSLTRSILNGLIKQAKKSQISEQIIGEMESAENLMAKLASQLQTINDYHFPSGNPKEIAIKLPKLRENIPLLFRGVNLHAPVVGRADAELVELTDGDYLELNSR